MKRHPLDPFSLVAGATFTLVGILFTVARVDFTGRGIRWIWPLPLVVLGALIIWLAARPADGARAMRDGDHDAVDAPGDPPAGSR